METKGQNWRDRHSPSLPLAFAKGQFLGIDFVVRRGSAERDSKGLQALCRTHGYPTKQMGIGPFPIVFIAGLPLSVREIKVFFLWDRFRACMMSKIFGSLPLFPCRKVPLPQHPAPLLQVSHFSYLPNLLSPRWFLPLSSQYVPNLSA